MSCVLHAVQRRTSTRVLPALFVLCLITTALIQLPAAHAVDAEASDVTQKVSLDDAETEVIDQQDSGAAAIDEKDVAVLTSKTFDAAIKNHTYALVEFYAPWCGHCKTLAPHYAKAATALKALDPSILLAKVDATVDAELTEKYGVEGFPTMKWFFGGETLNYNGGRVADDIIQWVKKKTGPPAKTIGTAKELKDALNTSSPVVVAYFKAFEGDAHATFLQVARASDKVDFLQTSDADVAKAAGADKGFVMYREFEGDKQQAVFEGTATKDALQNWIRAEQLPPYIEFNEANQDAIFESGIALSGLVILDRKDMVKGSAVTKAIKEAAAVTKGKLVWVLVDGHGDPAEQIKEFFGIKSDAPLPQVVGFNQETSLKYTMTDGFSASALSTFGKGLLDGSVKPTLKSQEVPTGDKAKEEGVTVVVGENFDDIVLSKDHDVLLEAYAPWCGHCQKLAPTYAKLAKRFEAVSSVVIAKVDATVNEHEQLRAEGYPTIWLWPAGSSSKKPIQFEGDRTLKELTAFVRKNAKLPVKLPQTDAELNAEDAADKAEAAKQAQAEDAEDQDSEEEEDIVDDGSEEDTAEGSAKDATGSAAKDTESDLHEEL